jgi:hypothetical protein
LVLALVLRVWSSSSCKVVNLSLCIASTTDAALEEFTILLQENWGA